MSYAPPSVGPAGLSIPSYTDILQLILNSFKGIYGQNVYLGNDSPDFQLISVISLALSDAMQSLQLDYNNKSPNFAVGAALDSLVKLNGIARKVATFSTCQAVITGTPNTVITNGVVSDNVFNNKWDLPTPLTIPGGGTITVGVICETLGAFSIPPGSLIRIATPTAGWVSVNNISSSVPGQPIETDSQLRSRQAISVELPSITLVAGTVAGIAATKNVTRFNVLENPTSAVDVFGNPPHSITCVVEGGTDLDVATSIYNNRGIGCFTNPTSNPGATTVPVTDQFTGIVLNVGFCRPTSVPIYVTVNAHLLPGGSSATLNAMKIAIVTYLNSLQIGELVSYAAVVAAAMSVSVNPDLTRPLVTLTSLFTGIAPGPGGTADIAMLFYKVAQGVTANVIINSV